ncbi:MAG TPA: A24 family peptidase [Limnobacter sp.]|nr:A24 family peptidase [Limnobacter sp.]
MIGLNSLDIAQWLALSAVLGVCVGSFLNVVAHRLPIMMERAWDAELAEIQEREPEEHPRFNLLWPPSHCTACKKRLHWWHNIPVISFILLRGRCAFCNSTVSFRYPLIELACSALFVGVAWLNPPGWIALGLMGFVSALLVLAVIDLDTYLLPDDITLPLLWAGLLFNLATGHVALPNAVLGAALGYVVLWLIYKGFKLFTGKEGMGYGDFKLLAAMGAWLGVASLFDIVLLASISGVFFGLAIQTIRGKKKNEAFPFGPCLVFGGLAHMAGLQLANWI